MMKDRKNMDVREIRATKREMVKTLADLAMLRQYGEIPVFQ